MKDGSCLTDRKSTHMEAHGSTLILAVDDEPTNHLVIEEIVTSQGYQVRWFCVQLCSSSMTSRMRHRCKSRVLCVQLCSSRVTWQQVYFCRCDCNSNTA